MKLGEIYSFLNSLSPFELAESWDNSGLMIGDMENEIKSVYLALEPSFETLQGLEHNSLLITHHPLIFSPLKRVDFSNPIAKIVAEAIKKDISIVAMHTNYDKTHLNDYFTKEILGFKEFCKDGFLNIVDGEFEFLELVKSVKEKLGLDSVNCVEKEGIVRKIAICTGSGASFISSLKADCLITGDVKYHDAMFAKERGVGVIDATHYATEKVFVDSIKENLKILPIRVIISNSKNPLKIF